MRCRYLLAVILVVGSLSAQTVPPAKAVPATPVAATIGGVWEMTMQTPQGDMTADATFVQDKEKIKFSMTGPQGMDLAGEGKVTGQDVEWTVTLSGPMGEFVLTYKGKVDGETMSGEVQAGDFGAFPWMAKKKK
jgi:hypothetical protein